VSNFLRDTTLRSLVITEGRLESLSQLLNEIIQNVNTGLAAADPQCLVYACIVRGDNKGSVLYDFDEVLRYFKAAKNIQRLVLVVNTLQNATAPFPGPLRVPFDGHGKCIFICLGQDELSHPQGLEFQPHIGVQISNLMVTDDDRAWTEATFVRVKEELDKYKSRINYFVRTPVVPVIIHLLLSVIAFGLAVIGAIRFSDFFTNPNAATLLFVLFMLMLYSAIGPLVHNPLIHFINRAFPNIAFRVSKTHWVIQGLVGALLASILAFVAKFVYSATLNEVLPYLKTSAQEIFK
jgi:hypothetical protein